MRNRPVCSPAKARQALTLVEVLLAMILLGGSSLTLMHLMRDYGRVVQRTEFEALAINRCQSVLALTSKSREPSEFNRWAGELSDDQMRLTAEVKEAGYDRLYLVSITATSKLLPYSPRFTVSRLIYMEAP